MNLQLLCVALCVVFAVAKADSRSELAQKINDGNFGWKASASRGAGGSPNLGLDFEMEAIEQERLGQAPLGAYTNADPPASFDARDRWPQCKTIGAARDQSECGSCWAFSSTEAFNDRMCIATGDFETILSPEDTNECVKVTSHGCNGGSISGAWNYFVNHGVPTGGAQATIGSGSTCKPYVFESCWHHEESDTLPSCSDISPPGGGPDGPDASTRRRLEGFKTPKCTRECSEDGYEIAYEDDLTKASSSYKVKGERNIMTELSTNGPVSAAFTVYEDFEMYTSGVYKHTGAGKSLGGHAIKLIGYGTDPDAGDYWIAVNSWNDTWGDFGTFKIARGTNECGIEGNVVTGLF
jgi:cathepsin B